MKLTKKITQLGGLTLFSAICAMSTPAFALIQGPSAYPQDRFEQEDNRFHGRYDREYNHFERDDRHFHPEGQYVQYQCSGRECTGYRIQNERDANDQYANRDTRDLRERQDYYGNRPANNKDYYSHPQARSPATEQDESIAKDIRVAIGAGYFTKGYEKVSGSVRNGNVVLVGSVDTLKDKEAVENAVRKVNGVHNVENNIKVVEIRKVQPSSKISESVDQANDEHTVLTPQETNVKTIEKEGTQATSADDQLSKNVRDALSPGMFTKGYEQVISSVKGGSVTLSGFVPTQKDKDAAEKAVRNVRGVRDVTNNIKAGN